MRKTFVMKDGELVEKKTIMQKRLQLISDIKTYQNMVNRGWITGRRQHREFLKQHNLVELGTDGGQIKDGTTGN